ncbi:DUF3662 and FHA domain-containing protein [Dactylosporangium sp. NPDC000555]|uniref:DUF3662 and FHA domain-containing protein n=1 Tax=Dactylosporangium sp. NPDC000555 TaxID=3154260 RepID=UPI003323DA74
MGALQRFEKRLEGMVEGTFAKVFKGVVHPVEILNAMQGEASANQTQMTGGRILVPNRYMVALAPADHSRLAPFAAALAQELAQSQAEYVGERGWAVYGDIVVEITRGDDLNTGLFRVAAQVYTGGQIVAGEGSGVRLVTADGQNFPLTRGTTIIGRGEQATLRLADVGASRQHARVEYDGNRAVLTDLGSANGSLVNGHRVDSVTLTPGDEIMIGTTRLSFRV